MHILSNSLSGSIALYRALILLKVMKRTHTYFFIKKTLIEKWTVRPRSYFNQARTRGCHDNLKLSVLLKCMFNKLLNTSLNLSLIACFFHYLWMRWALQYTQSSQNSRNVSTKLSCDTALCIFWFFNIFERINTKNKSRKKVQPRKSDINYPSHRH